MHLPDGLLDASWTSLAWAVFVLIAARAAQQAPWRVLGDSARLNAFLGLLVALLLLWHIKAGVKPGLTLHLLGATVLTLCFGWRLAFLGLSLVLVGVTLNGFAGWQALAANALLMAGVGVAVSELIHRLVDRLLPQHVFVYIFCQGFFASALAVFAVGTVSCLFLALAGAYDGEYLREEYLPYFLLLGFSEAWLSGTLTTLLVVYRPDLLANFEDKRYFGQR